MLLLLLQMLLLLLQMLLLLVFSQYKINNFTASQLTSEKSKMILFVICRKNVVEMSTHLSNDTQSKVFEQKKLDRFVSK